VTKKRSKQIPKRRRSVTDISQAMLKRVKQRIAASGTLRIPAVPGLIDSYVELCSRFFSASGRHFSSDEAARAKSLVASTLGQAFTSSQRSKIVVNFQAEPGCALGYSVDEEVSTVADAYERWIGTTDAPLFGAHPDARVLALSQTLTNPETSPVLDLGAGTGRNAFALAKKGFPVDAVELTPRFAEMLSKEAKVRNLPVRVVAENVFLAKDKLRRDYQFFFASEVVPDFRGVADLRQLFELASEVLVQGGTLLFNIHLAEHGFTPDKAAREFAQQCYSALFTANEVREALHGLPLELIANDSVYRYERDTLPKEAWPPTPWFINWVSGLDVYEIETKKCPIELRWLAFRRASAEGAVARHSDFETIMNAERFEEGRRGPSKRPRKFDGSELRAALVRRLKRRAVAAGTLTLPAVPALSNLYATFCFDVFGSLGRELNPEQTSEVQRLIERALNDAFTASPRSNIVVTYEITMGSEVHYTVTPAPIPVSQAYEDWHEDLAESLFGSEPDARLVSVVEQMPPTARILDIGAGTGRNALWLAKRGHVVDAVEMAPKFIQLIEAEASSQGLSLKVIPGNFFENSERIGRDYALAVASAFVGDLRGLQELRQLLEFASARLTPDGKLLLNLHLAVYDYEPDAAARQWAQQCCATFFTQNELAQALNGLPLAIIENDPAFDYERSHLPEEGWPPTAAFPEWAQGQHMFALEPEECPIELRWLLMAKSRS